MNRRHKKILTTALIASVLLQLTCCINQSNAQTPFETMPMMMNGNSDRFLPMGIETPDPDAKLPQRKPKAKAQKLTDGAPAQEPVEIISDHMDYFRDEDKMVATGNAMVISQDKKSKLKADKITFFRDTNELIAEGNVRVIKPDSIVYGSFMRTDLNKNTSFMSNPKTGNGIVKIVAREGYVYSKDMEFLKGHAKFVDGINAVMATEGFYTGFEDLDRARMEKLPSSPRYQATHKERVYRIKAKEIVIESGKDRNLIAMKGATIYRNKKRVGTVSRFAVSGDKAMGDMETTLPEIGYRRQLGTYLGPGYLFNGPKSSTVKFSPLLMIGGTGETGETSNGGLGIGGFATVRTDRNITELGYGTIRRKLIIRGKQEFDDPRYTFNYSVNDFMDDWFMGGKMPYRYAELAFKDKIAINDLGLLYDYKYSGAVASDYKVGNSGDWRMNSTDAQNKLPKHELGWSTMKLKAQGQFSRQKPIWEIKDKVILNAVAQYDINQYGTGQTMSIVRFGPTLSYLPTEKLRLRGGYYVSGVQGETPFAWDQYYLGKQSATIAYEYQLTKKLAIGATNSLNILKDNFDGRMLVENKYFIKYGPEDFKFCFSYDTVWRRTAVGLNMLVGSNNSDVEFDKLKVKNYKRLQTQQEKAKAEEEKEKKKKEEKI